MENDAHFWMWCPFINRGRCVANCKYCTESGNIRHWHHHIQQRVHRRALLRLLLDTHGSACASRASSQVDRGCRQIIAVDAIVEKSCNASGSTCCMANVGPHPHVSFHSIVYLGRTVRQAHHTACFALGWYIHSSHRRRSSLHGRSCIREAWF